MKVLIVDDNVEFATTIAGIIHSFNVEADCVHSPQLAVRYLEQNHSEIMLILLDIEFGFGEQMNGLDLLDIFRREYISIPVVMISGKGTIETAVKATKLGAVNFIEKNIISKDKIQNIIEAIINNRSGYGNDEDIKKFLESNGIIGSSKAIMQIGESIIRYGRTDLNILITGDTGTGKTLVATAIHKISRRMRARMVTVDIPNITKDKFYSDFFGYIYGAFDGAKETTKGFFQQADKSSLFFDEIGALPLELQPSLLIPIEEKSIHKLGSIDNEKVDIRFIAATSTDLLSKIKDKQFSEQLYHRLRECEIHIPSLRSRQEDIPEIINYLTKYHNAEYQESKYFSSNSIEFLVEQIWQGNVRELDSIVKASLQTKLSSKSDIIEIQDIMREFNNSRMNINSLQSTAPALSLDKTLGEDVAEINKIKIERALMHTNGNVSKSAALLGVSRETLHNKIRKYGINHQKFRIKDGQ